MRLVILCEGDTEKKVLEDFLKPYCQKLTWGGILNSRGSGNLKNEFKELAERELKADAETVVFCLIDLLESPFSFPKNVQDDPDPYLAQYGYIRRLMQEQVSETLRDRFYVFPIVMELETWLLADYEALKSYFGPEHVKPWPAPETVLKPADELGRLMWVVRKTKYRKPLHGQAIFRKADAERVYRDACPHFVLMIDELLRLQGLKTDQPPETFIPDEELYQKLAALNYQYDDLWQTFEEKSDAMSDEECARLDSQMKSVEEEMESVNDEIVRLYRQE
jgi:hypothetical protein